MARFRLIVTSTAVLVKPPCSVRQRGLVYHDLPQDKPFPDSLRKEGSLEKRAGGKAPGGHVAAPATAQPLKEGDQQSPGASTGAAGTASPAPPVAQGGAQLTLEFPEDCWVDIKDADGKQLAYGVMKANTVQNLTGAAPFSLALGNPWAVRMKLNGAPVDKQVYLPKRGSVSRFVLESSGNPQSSP